MPERDTTPTLPGLWMWPGMMPILHSPGVMTPGQLGPIRRVFEPLERALHLHHVEHRDALGDADDQLDAGVDRFAGSRRRRTAAARRSRDALAPVFFAASATVSKTGRLEMRRAAFARRDAADHLGAVGDRLRGWNVPFLPVMPWR